MALAKPEYSKIAKLDQRMQQLQEEVSYLEKEYGFSEQFAMKFKEQKEKKRTTLRERSTNKSTTSRSSIVEKDSNRYKGLTKIKPKAEQVPQVIVKPEIASDWQEAHKLNPNLFAFYDKDLYQPRHFDDKEFNAKPTFTNNFDYFNECMSTFAVDFDKLPEKYAF